MSQNSKLTLSTDYSPDLGSKSKISSCENLDFQLRRPEELDVPHRTWKLQNKGSVFMNFYHQLDLNKTKPQHCRFVRFVTVRYVWLLIWELLKVYNISGRSDNNIRCFAFDEKPLVWNFQWWMKLHFPKFSEKRGQPWEVFINFQKYITKWIFMQFCFSLGIWLIDFSEIQQFPDFQENSQEFPEQFFKLWKFWNFWPMESGWKRSYHKAVKVVRSYCFNLLLLLPVVQEMPPNLTGFHCVWKTCHLF